MDSDWSEEGWDGDKEREKRREMQRREVAMRKKLEEERHETALYFPPSPQYIPTYEEKPPTLVTDMVL